MGRSVEDLLVLLLDRGEVGVAQNVRYREKTVRLEGRQLVG
jgi:hypothetical protein